ncbi:glutathione S-transferase family protein [Dyella lutea]|uniref:Glutathione S-transferase family protein n=1 Tax=Dyella lutea TaxID=2950441 RepID=A0ABT1F555_9GAMM|nr:glutathione S-transferase family protein [Dyella lutea]MCP1372522.1 glutathione S-transferase family protein [Dyella lutea]
MLTLFDYLPSQNAWKVRQLLQHLQHPYRTVEVSIFEGDGQQADYLRISPTGTVPAIRLEDGRALAESNAILMYLAEGTPYLPDDAFGRARVWQWLSFEQERVESVIGALRHWTLTGKLARRAPAIVEAKRAAARRTLAILERELAERSFLAGERYTIADIAVFAYGSRADEAGFLLDGYPAIRGWIGRVRAQAGHLATMHPYDVDPHSSGELP